MTAPPDDTTTDLHVLIAALRTERDAALSEKAALAEELAAQTVELAERKSEFGERIAQQAATIDVLKVMSASPGDPQPVFDLIVRRATELCNGLGTALFEFDGGLVHYRASYFTEALATAANVAYAAAFPSAPTRGSISCRAILDREIVHIRDTDADLELSQVARELHNATLVRSQISIPLMRDGQAIGAISLAANDPGGFSDSQIELLKTFAEQAVIAITSAETYRALQSRTSDLQETLEYQTATSEVLKVISRSAFDLQPVLDTVVETAARLCDADMAGIGRREGELIRGVAFHGYPPENRVWIKSLGAMPLDRHIVGHRAALEGRVVHVHDVAAEPNYPTGSIALGKMRTSLGVPLLREGETVGSIVLARQRVEPFTDSQIQLVSTFADQAVIAIENTRLIAEQREALEQQTATAEVLQVINRSRGDLVPVFDAILESAHSLCDITRGSLELYDGVRFHAVAVRGLSAALADTLRQGYPASDNPATRPLIEGGRLSHIRDLAETDYSITRSSVETDAARTLLCVPLRRDETLLGMIASARGEVRPFSEKEIALLENFAAQAVIAMENARLINEQREALEQQTATAEVLQVTNASPGDLTPVFDAMLEKALHLCEAAFGVLWTYDGERIHAVALRGMRPAFAEFLTRTPHSVGPDNAHGRLLHGEFVVHIADVMDDEAYRSGDPMRRSLVELGNARTLLAVPLRKDESFLGDFVIYRQEARPFADKHQSFNITLERDFGEGIAPIEVNPQDITRVFLNIFSNGFYATTSRARDGGDAGFVPTLKVTTRDAGEAVEIRVWDNGTGIPADIRDKLFQPFFTTKPTGEGTGLGLSITYDIVTQQHGGNIAVDSKVGEYSEFTIQLPRNP